MAFLSVEIDYHPHHLPPLYYAVAPVNHCLMCSHVCTQVEVTGVLGQGSWGTVYGAMWKGMQVAMKVHSTLHCAMHALMRSHSLLWCIALSCMVHYVHCVDAPDCLLEPADACV